MYMLRALLAALLLTMLVPPAPGVAVTTGDETVIFDGSGWGHGVGLSQYGAYGMAVEGSTANQIISHYYSGSTVAVEETLPIWVNLERDFSTLQLTVGNAGDAAGAPVVISSPASPTPLNALPGATITISVPAPGCSVSVVNPGEDATVISDPVCLIDFEWYAWETPGQTPTTKITIDGCFLADWNVTPTTPKPCAYARGMLHLRTGPGGLDLSAEMLIDDYVLGTSEMPYAWSTHALRAQAIASRSYAVARQLERPNLASNSCDGWCHVKDTTADQRYVGWGHGKIDPWIAAVQATAGQIVSHPTAPNGVVTAYFSSSSGGNTENVEERFGGPPRAYLKSVDDSVAIDGTVLNPKASWQFVIPAAVVASAVGLDQILDVEITETRSGSGSAAIVKYSGISGGQYMEVEKTGTWTRTNFGLYSEYFDVNYTGVEPAADEMFFYRNDGAFGFYSLGPDGSLGGPILAGSGYTSGWDAITAVDLDGDGQDEMFFYRADGLFRFYNVKPDGSLGLPILSGTGYTKGWDAITAVDLDGDGRDEMFFYRADGLFRFYNVNADGSLPKPMLAGSGYTKGWDAITAVDLDGDGQDEMFFYRNDGLFRYYNVKPDGNLPKPMLAGSGYTSGWDQITAVDVDGDGQDEMFFYRKDGLFRYYNIKATGSLGTPMQAGSTYELDWEAITAVQLDAIPK
jgi:SpoIID/LytB domain protein